MVDAEPLDALQPDELINEGKSDLLGEDEILEQLVDMIRTVELGSAIGLFGSPGIGKTTICKRLKNIRRKDGTCLRFVEVDASESGGAGFRRQLVLACAKELDRNVGKVARRLRGASSHSRFGPPSRRHLLLVPLILLILAVMVAVGLGIAAVVAWATDAADFDAIANDFVLAMLFAPAVAAAAFGLLAKSVTTEWTMPAPASDDEFVNEFDRLFKDDTEQLLVFVDEIDRSTPERIADALDGLRTFFGPNKQCVFLVAADRQTLEHGLSAWLGESTPEHAANPYYGAASAYLDKLFRYQLIVPPLRTNSLYQYARQTTKGRSGVWELLNADDGLSRGVIDVLIPPHVASPRQANALLNGFVLTCHLLHRREPKMFDSSRFREIAKLVCLRCEFPLFAADLHVDPRLPERVLDAVREIADGADPARLGRAGAYAEGRLPVSNLPMDRSPQADTSDPEVDRELRRQQSRQLVAYLERTSRVDGPRPDIIHARAFQSELPPELAEELSEAALRFDCKRLDKAMDAVRANGKPNKRKSLRTAERNALDMLSLRVRAKQEKETVDALRSLLYVVRACKYDVDAQTAELVLQRITSARAESEGRLSGEHRDTLKRLEAAAENGKLPGMPTGSR